MKMLFCFLFLISMRGCAQSDVKSIVYNASSRGFYYNIELSENEIGVRNIRGAEKALTAPLKSEQWDQIVALINNLKIDSWETIEAPSQKSHVDAAAIATFMLKDGKGEIIGETRFDHGNPPEVLKPLVNTILLLAETVEKQ
ncbi:hypothetical protein [Ascidiimonas aurantiaca]|uniref:hypothetical protein n=1 Tax=Ascidiimonas aurantiaca TaxID=1685432 RepID=UPI0030EE9016